MIDIIMIILYIFYITIVFHNLLWKVEFNITLLNTYALIRGHSYLITLYTAVDLLLFAKNNCISLFWIPSFVSCNFINDLFPGIFKTSVLFIIFRKIFPIKYFLNFKKKL